MRYDNCIDRCNDTLFKRRDENMIITEIPKNCVMFTGKVGGVVPYEQSIAISVNVSDKRDVVEWVEIRFQLHREQVINRTVGVGDTVLILATKQQGRTSTLYYGMIIRVLAKRQIAQRQQAQTPAESDIKTKPKARVTPQPYEKDDLKLASEANVDEIKNKPLTKEDSALLTTENRENIENGFGAITEFEKSKRNETQIVSDGNALGVSEDPLDQEQEEIIDCTGDEVSDLVSELT